MTWKIMLHRVFLFIALLSSVMRGAETPLVPPPPPNAEKLFKVDEATGSQLVSFEDLNLRKVLSLKELPTDVEKRLPEGIAGLNEKIVRITGWMFPPPRETGLPAFLLLESNDIMHFGRPYQADEKIGVRMKSGTTASYIPGRPFDVVGTLKMESKLRDGELFLLYLIEDAVVLEK